MKEGEYKCAVCGGVFEKGWSDEEAAAEYELNKTGIEEIDNDVAVVCDDCFTDMKEEFKLIRLP